MISQLAEKIGVADFFNAMKIKQLSREPSKVLRDYFDTHDIVIMGKGDVSDFYTQPLVVIPLNDYLAQLKTVKTNNRGRR